MQYITIRDDDYCCIQLCLKDIGSLQTLGVQRCRGLFRLMYQSSWRNEQAIAEMDSWLARAASDAKTDYDRARLLRLLCSQPVPDGMDRRTSAAIRGENRRLQTEENRAKRAYAFAQKLQTMFHSYERE